MMINGHNTVGKSGYSEPLHDAGLHSCKYQYYSNNVEWKMFLPQELTEITESPAAEDHASCWWKKC